MTKKNLLPSKIILDIPVHTKNIGITNTVCANKRLEKIFLEVQVRILFLTKIKYKFFSEFSNEITGRKQITIELDNQKVNNGILE
jgi:hypothetical protein